MRIALAGNPNSGKTTMYNLLTGKNETVGNWAGVTVDKNESPIRKRYSAGRDDVIIVDLPGAYSISAFTSEESITSDYVRNAHPDVIINIVDSTNLSRSLFFTTQLLELGIPVVVALNKTDVSDKRHNKINTSRLSEMLGCPVVSTSADDGVGVDGRQTLFQTGNLNVEDLHTPCIPLRLGTGNKGELAQGIKTAIGAEGALATSPHGEFFLIFGG